MEVKEIDNIYKVKSEIKYINHYIGRVELEHEGVTSDFYIGFSLEYQALGIPLVRLKFIDPPEDYVKAGEDLIKQKIIAMDRDGSLRDLAY